MTNYSEKDMARGEEVRAEMIGPRCQECGGCGPNAPKWAGELHGWCECAEDDEMEVFSVA